MANVPKYPGNAAPTKNSATIKTILEQFASLSLDDAMASFAEIRKNIQERINKEHERVDKHMCAIKEFCANNSI